MLRRMEARMLEHSSPIMYVAQYCQCIWGMRDSTSTIPEPGTISSIVIRMHNLCKFVFIQFWLIPI